MTKPRWEKIRVNRIHPGLGPLIFSLQQHNCYIAGGYARWACSPREDSPLPKDIDVICPSATALEAVRSLLLERRYRQGLETNFAITFRGLSPGVGRDLQLLKLFHGDTIEDCLDQIDFTICRVAITGMDSAIADARFLGHEQCNQLELASMSNASMPENTIFRLLRYAKKGYDFKQEDVMKALDRVREASKITGELVEQPSSFDLFGS